MTSMKKTVLLFIAIIGSLLVGCCELSACERKETCCDTPTCCSTSSSRVSCLPDVPFHSLSVFKFVLDVPLTGPSRSSFSEFQLPVSDLHTPFVLGHCFPGSFWESVQASIKLQC